jgi:hypothetical protein
MDFVKPSSGGQPQVVHLQISAVSQFLEGKSQKTNRKILQNIPWKNQKLYLGHPEGPIPRWQLFLPPKSMLLFFCSLQLWGLNLEGTENSTTGLGKKRIIKRERERKLIVPSANYYSEAMSPEWNRPATEMNLYQDYSPDYCTREKYFNCWNETVLMAKKDWKSSEICSLFRQGWIWAHSNINKELE